MEQLIERYSAVPQSQRYLLLLVVIGGMVFLHWYLVYDSQQSEITRLTADYAKKQGVKNEKENIAQNKTTYEAKLGKLQSQLDEARAKLPDGANVPQLLAQLGSRARQSGLSIGEFKPLNESVRDFYAEIGFKLSGSGSYHDVGMFIDSVGKLDRIINVSNLKLKSPTEKDSKVVVSAEFDVKTYRFVSPEEQAAREAANDKNKKKKKKRR